MDANTRQLVRQRASDVCEYCGLPQEATPFISFHVEHIIAKQHGGMDDPAQLALACDRCNAYKGPNLTSVDPESGNVVALFNPRQDSWTEHFSCRAGAVIGLTPTGRATVRLLNMNDIRRVELRVAWLNRDERAD